MQTDLEIIRELEKEIGQEIKEVKDLDIMKLSTYPAYQLDSQNHVVRLADDAVDFKKIPKAIFKLRNLERLSIYRNKLNALPSEIGRLTNLKMLYLFENHLHALPPEIGQLKNLIMLYLGDNHLTELPPEIGQMTNLKELNLKRNRLSALPAEIAQLRKLVILHLDGNPLKQPPPEIVEQGIPAIFKYLKQIEIEALEIVNEAKMILVGQGDVGKTCLANRLIYDIFKEEKSTEGIDVLKWNICAPTTEKEDIRLNVWDFGG